MDAKSNRVRYSDIILPNVRKIFIPDPGYTMFEADLKGADAQVVAWEADDDDLKAAFRAGLDVHAKNAEDMLGSAFTSLTGHARDVKRQENKKAVHATNYLGSARTLAKSLGWTVHEADRFQKRWFDLHPGIKNNFHGRIKAALASTRTVYNIYGDRRYYFGRIDDCLSEAVAWVPQSTVAQTTYLGAFNLEARSWPDQLRPHPGPLTPSGLMLQVHDSIIFQFPTSSCPPLEELQKVLQVETPYPDPLIIPWDIKASAVSWGDMQPWK